MINIELVEFYRPNSPIVEVGIRINNEELGRSIIIDGDFNTVLNCTYDTFRRTITSFTGIKPTYEYVKDYLKRHNENDT